jgi:hypothetical protein
MEPQKGIKTGAGQAGANLLKITLIALKINSMDQKSQLEQKIKDLKPHLVEQFRVSSIGYFGSYAKNKATDKSDIDLLVEFSETPGWEFLKLKFFLEEKLNRNVDLVTSNALKKELRKSILKEVEYV